MASTTKNFFKIGKSESMGRYATATKALTAGSVICEEYPFVVGPKPSSQAVCLECCGPVDGTSAGPRCNKCFWPLCEDCKLNSTRKYHSKECELFRENKVIFQNLPTANHECLQLDCITPLR